MLPAPSTNGVSEIILLDPAMIRQDRRCQPRETIDPHVVEDYEELIRDGTTFPPIDVFFDGLEYWLADGFHRVPAFVRADADRIAARVSRGWLERCDLVLVRGKRLAWPPKKRRR